MSMFVSRSMPVVTGVFLAASVVLSGQALAQQPSQEQISAVRASCRSDFISHCSGVRPGGVDALRCLQRNLGGLSASCRTAVSAVIPKKTEPVEAPPPAPAEPAPAPAAAAPEAAPPAEAPPPSAPAPSADAPIVAPPATRPASRRRAAAPPAATAPGSPPPAVEAPVTLGPIPPLPIRARLAILRACRPEHRAYCADAPPGGGRIVECLAQNAGALSPTCRQTIVLMTR
jgi:hypothetical protein